MSYQKLRDDFKTEYEKHQERQRRITFLIIGGIWTLLVLGGTTFLMFLG